MAVITIARQTPTTPPSQWSFFSATDSVLRRNLAHLVRLAPSDVLAVAAARCQQEWVDFRCWLGYCSKDSRNCWCIITSISTAMQHLRRFCVSCDAARQAVPATRPGAAALLVAAGGTKLGTKDFQLQQLAPAAEAGFLVVTVSFTCIRQRVSFQ